MRRILVLVTLIAASVAPSYALDQFTWLNPRPQGHALRDVEFLSESVAIAVGDYGTILASYDAGATWEVVITRLNGIDSHLNRVVRLDASTAIAVGENGRIVKSTDAGVTWTEISSGTTNVLRDVHFVTPQHGMAVGNGVALRTSDGGASWQSLPLGGSFDLHGVYLHDLSHAIAVGGYFILRTATGGDSWSSEMLPGFIDVYDIDFGSPLDGAIGTGYNHILKTADGGLTWDPVYLDELHVAMSFLEVDYVNASTILLATTVAPSAPETGMFDRSFGAVQQSTNGGNNWQQDGFMQLAVHGIATSPSGAIRLTVGDGGVIARYTGANWQVVSGSSEDYLDGTFDASFLDAGTGVVAGSACECHNNNTVFLRTSDGGQTWLKSYQSDHTSRNIEHASPSVLYSVGTKYFAASASLVKSTNGGASWSEIWASPTVKDLMGLAFSSPSYGVAVGNAGKVAVIDNDVVSVHESGVTGYLRGVAFADASTWVAFGHDGQFASTVHRMVRSVDGGETWSPVNYGPAIKLNGLAFLDDEVGFAVGVGGAILKTVDAGQTWSSVPSGTTSELTSIEFANATHGVVVATGGKVLRTFDGGANWDEVNVSPTPLVSRVAYPEPGKSFLIGSQQFVIGYEFSPVPTSVPDTPSPKGLELLSNIPNPFNPSTTIHYVVPETARVRVTIYDVSGRAIATLVDRHETAGPHSVSWNGTDSRGESVASGIYLARLESGGQSRSRKMVLLK